MWRALITVLVMLVPVSAQATIVAVFQLKNIAAAPVLLVGRVQTVHKDHLDPESALPGKEKIWHMIADVEVLRSYSPNVPQHIRVEFLENDPLPPPSGRALAVLTVDSSFILPLKLNSSPDSTPWQMIANEGASLLVPVRPELASGEPAAGDAWQFVMREISNTLAHGTPGQVSAIGTVLAKQMDDLRPSLMPLLEPVIGEDRRRWAELATNLLASRGIPRPTVAELMAADHSSPAFLNAGNVGMAQAALKKLGPGADTDALLINCWFDSIPLHAWSSVVSLAEYAGNPLARERLQAALRSDVSGVLQLAVVFGRSGHRETMPDAMARALRVLEHLNGMDADLFAAVSLLVQFGDSSQLRQLVASVRKYQTGNRGVYSSLWQLATQDGNLRAAPVLAVVLADRRISFDEWRYCDLAAATLERGAGEDFGARKAKTREEKDQAVLRAQNWLKAHGIAE